MSKRRADAERSIAAILDAAVRTLPDHPDAGMGEIARAAGVSRQTVYAHFASREALLSAVAERALEQTLAAIDAAEPERGDAREALDRLVRAWWESVARHARGRGDRAHPRIGFVGEDGHGRVEDRRDAAFGVGAHGAAS